MHVLVGVLYRTIAMTVQKSTRSLTQLSWGNPLLFIVIFRGSWRASAMYRCHCEEHLIFSAFTTPSPHPTEVLLDHVPMHLFSTLPGHIVDATRLPLDIESALAISSVSSTTPVIDFVPQLSTVISYRIHYYLIPLTHHADPHRGSFTKACNEILDVSIARCC